MTNLEEPTVWDVSCPRCKAEPGEPCMGTAQAFRYGHQSRQDRMIRAYNKWVAAR